MSASRPVVVVLHGPSGAGKDTVIAALRERTGIHRALSTTSRAPRDGERDGADYYFVTEQEFENRIAAGAFLEYARVYGQWKGLESREVVPYLEEGHDVIIRTDVQGARTWREKLPQAIFVFLAAEDRDALRARLVSRGSENSTSLAVRMEEVEAELADMENNDYVVVNRHGDSAAAAAEIAQIIEDERTRAPRSSVARG